MNPTAKVTVRDLRPGPLSPALVIVGLLLAGAAGCLPKTTATPPTAPSTTEQPAERTVVPLPARTTEVTSVPAGWETHTSPRFLYSLSYPVGMEGTDSGEYSWTLGMKLTNPDEAARNFVYLSVIPAGFQSDGGEIYNYNTPEADILLNMQVGESQSVHEGVDPVPGFTYTRQTDTTLSGLAAKTYENTEPWEFPDGTKEIRYYLRRDGYTYLIGGYIDTIRANQPGAITEAFFNQLVATVRVGVKGEKTHVPHR